MTSHTEVQAQPTNGEKQVETDEPIEEAVDAYFGIPDSEQVRKLHELTALYYALLGPQSVLERSSTVSRPPFPVASAHGPIKVQGSSAFRGG